MLKKDKQLIEKIKLDYPNLYELSSDEILCKAIQSMRMRGIIK